MSVKYSRLPTNDPDTVSDSVAIDFTSIFDYEKEADGHKTRKSVFDYSFDSSKIFGTKSNRNKYKSAFTYSNGFDPHSRKSEPLDYTESSAACKICASILTAICFLLLWLTFPITGWFSIKKLPTYERIVIYRLGRLLGAKGPGVVFILPCIDRISRVDLRQKAFSVPPQKGLTSDGATCEVGAEIYYRVKDATLSVSNIQDLNKSTRDICETILQKHIVKYELSDLTMSKINISQNLITDINQMTQMWGVEVTRTDLSQVKVISEPNTFVQQGNNPLSFLGPMLFPSGSSNMPLDQLPQVPGFSQGGQDLEFPDDPSSISPHLLAQCKKQELEYLQKQHPHLKDELVTLMNTKSPNNAEPSASGMPGPSQVPGPSHVPQHMMRYRSPRDLLKAIVPRLNSEIVAEFMCIYKFVVTGPGGGTFYLDLKHHEGDADEGEPRMGIADVTLTLSMEDLDSLLTGQTSAFAAYMTGKIEVDGDMGLASKLGDIVELLKR